MIVIEPQSELPAKDIIITLAKYFELSSIQMHNKLVEGFSAEIDCKKFQTVLRLLQDNRIAYKAEGSVDLREKYPFYMECGYPYSRMRFLL